MISQSILTSPSRIKRCTGLTLEQFSLLSQRLDPIWRDAEIKRLSRDDRKKRIGQGHPYGLKTIEEKLFCILLWYKLYPELWFLGMSVGLDASNVSRLIIKLRPLLEKATDPELKRKLRELIQEHQRRVRDGKRISSWEDLKRDFPDIAEILIDATEGQILKPNKRVQKRYYSGKKKRHTLKTQIITNPQGQILHISKTYPGRVHDFDLLQMEIIMKYLPSWLRIYLDRGYQGIKKKFPDLTSFTPIKKNRWKSYLTRSEKIYNTKLSKKRIAVEHVISRLKKYQILSQIFRNKRKYYNQDFRNIAAIVNFRLAFTSS